MLLELCDRRSRHVPQNRISTQFASGFRPHHEGIGLNLASTRLAQVIFDVGLKVIGMLRIGEIATAAGDQIVDPR